MGIPNYSTGDYGVQVSRKDGKGEVVWDWVHPTGRDPYRMETQEDAEKFIRMFYPNCTPNQVRVRPFLKPLSHG